MKNTATKDVEIILIDAQNGIFVLLIHNSVDSSNTSASEVKDILSEYQPVNLKDYASYSTQLDKLSLWLNKWKSQYDFKKIKKSSKHGKMRHKSLKCDSSNSDSSDFESQAKRKCKSKNDVYSIDYDDESCDGQLFSWQQHIYILSGPCSVGKSSIVHFLAEQLNFKVFELNCSNKRCAKNILNQFQTSISQHHLSTNYTDAETRLNGIASFFKPLSKNEKFSPLNDTEHTYKKETLKRKRKKNKNDEKIHDITNFFKPRKAIKPVISQSEILVPISKPLYESLPNTRPSDKTIKIDILSVEYDKGFWTAVNGLISQAKRPIIFTATNIKNILNNLQFPYYLCQLELPLSNAKAIEKLCFRLENDAKISREILCKTLNKSHSLSISLFTGSISSYWAQNSLKHFAVAYEPFSDSENFLNHVPLYPIDLRHFLNQLSFDYPLISEDKEVENFSPNSNIQTEKLKVIGKESTLDFFSLISFFYDEISEINCLKTRLKKNQISSAFEMIDDQLDFSLLNMNNNQDSEEGIFVDLNSNLFGTSNQEVLNDSIYGINSCMSFFYQSYNQTTIDILEILENSSRCKVLKLHPFRVTPLISKIDFISNHKMVIKLISDLISTNTILNVTGGSYTTIFREILLDCIPSICKLSHDDLSRQKLISRRSNRLFSYFSKIGIYWPDETLFSLSEIWTRHFTKK